MAKRYSGDLKIDIAWDDRTSQYRARLCPRGGRRRDCETVHVGAPKTLTRGVDNPKSYDEAAHAAISFSSNDIQQRADMTGSGWAIRRKR